MIGTTTRAPKARPRVGDRRPKHVRSPDHYVPVQPFRERMTALLAEFHGITGGPQGGENALPSPITLALERIGWGEGDDTRLMRMIGLRPESITTRNGRRYGGGYRQSVTIANAELMCRALDMDPHEAGV